MSEERLVELQRKAYGRGGSKVHHPDLWEACEEIRRLKKLLQGVKT